MYHLLFYRRTSREKYFRFHSVEAHNITEVYNIPDTPNVKALSKYDETSLLHIPLVTLATGGSSTTYTIANWHLQKKPRKYTFHRRKIPRLFVPNDLEKKFFLLPFLSHVSWFQKTPSVHTWCRTSTVPLASVHVVLPRALPVTGFFDDTLFHLFRNAMKSAQSKNSLVLA